ncbi:MAG: O-antigen ligase family protein [Alphaproteobacteria bacterium]|nr:O-antigen ligase family protein [Alphaproteobacteria bacterium]
MLIGSAILLTRSRGGMIAAVVGVAALLALSFRGRRLGGLRRALIASPVLLALVAMGVTTGGHTWTRLTDELRIEGNDRLLASGLALDGIAERPWTGIGWGGYEADFRIRRTADFQIGRDQLENDYLQQALELGPIPALAFLAAPALLGWICLRGVGLRRRDQTLPALGVATTALVATHALVDFSLRIPAPMLLYAALMGMAVAQSFRTEEAKP